MDRETTSKKSQRQECVHVFEKLLGRQLRLSGQKEEVRDVNESDLET